MNKKFKIDESIYNIYNERKKSGFFLIAMAILLLFCCVFVLFWGLGRLSYNTSNSLINHYKQKDIKKLQKLEIKNKIDQLEKNEIPIAENENENESDVIDEMNLMAVE